MQRETSDLNQAIGYTCAKRVNGETGVKKADITTPTSHSPNEAKED
jgi:hypothetical protein